MPSPNPTWAPIDPLEAPAFLAALSVLPVAADPACRTQLTGPFGQGPAGLLGDPPAGALLQFARDTGVYAAAAATAPRALEAQLAEFFPGLRTALEQAGAPPGRDARLVDLFDEVAFEDVRTGAHGATTGVYHFRLRGGAGHLVAKRTDMSVERVLADLLRSVAGLSVVTIRWCGPVFSLMDPVPGLSLRDMTGNPLGQARKCAWSPGEVAHLARELGREGALAWYLRLHSRHSGNLICPDPSRLTVVPLVRIDFGQSLLPTRLAYTEAVMPWWHLRRFFPGQDNLPYEQPEVAGALATGFMEMACQLRRARGRVQEQLRAATGLPLPEMAAEAADPRVTAEAVAGIDLLLAAATPPADTFNILYNRFYLDGWQVAGWTEHRPARGRMFETAGDDAVGLLPPENWAALARPADHPAG